MYFLCAVGIVKRVEIGESSWSIGITRAARGGAGIRYGSKRFHQPSSIRLNLSSGTRGINGSGSILRNIDLRTVQALLEKGSPGR